MIKWRIPAKTFLLGEYAALLEGSAIVLTTDPCFEVSLVEDVSNHSIHPESPAGKYWVTHSLPGYNLRWHDPYHGQGGLGASSAQFVGAYSAVCHLLHLPLESKGLLEAYYDNAWRGEGLRPSGYDVLAQSQRLCVYINRHNNVMQNYEWPFEDIAFLLLHSGEKLATHYHLQGMRLPDGIHLLSPIVEQAKTAFEQADSESLVTAVNSYQQHLTTLRLMAGNTLHQIRVLQEDPEILAAKGCGAMGADVLLLIVPNKSLASQTVKLKAQGWTILADSSVLFKKNAVIKKNPNKTLEIIS